MRTGAAIIVVIGVVLACDIFALDHFSRRRFVLEREVRDWSISSDFKNVQMFFEMKHKFKEVQEYKELERVSLGVVLITVVLLSVFFVRVIRETILEKRLPFQFGIITLLALTFALALILSAIQEFVGTLLCRRRRIGKRMDSRPLIPSIKLPCVPRSTVDECEGQGRMAWPTRPDRIFPLFPAPGYCWDPFSRSM